LPTSQECHGLLHKSSRFQDEPEEAPAQQLLTLVQPNTSRNKTNGFQKLLPI